MATQENTVGVEFGFPSMEPRIINSASRNESTAPGNIDQEVSFRTVPEAATNSTSSSNASTSSTNKQIDSLIDVSQFTEKVLAALQPTLIEQINNAVKASIQEATMRLMEALERTICQQIEKKVQEHIEAKLKELCPNNANSTNTCELDKIDAIDQKQKWDCLRVFGVPTKPDSQWEKREETLETVKNIANSMDVQISEHDITECYRTHSQAKSKPIVIRFNNSGTRLHFLQNKKKLKGSKIYIEEELTPRRSKLAHEIRTSEAVNAQWIRSGKIFFTLKEDTKKKHCVTTPTEAAKILNWPKDKLSSFSTL